jgi:GxxExxY protein
LTEAIIKGFYKVYNTLGHGFLERVYENALSIELRKMGLKVAVQHPVKIYYDGQTIGHYFSDMIVDGRVILEIKAVATLDKAHEAQLLNYLRATEIEVGLLLNFGVRPEFRRKIFSNEKKNLPGGKGEYGS